MTLIGFGILILPVPIYFLVKNHALGYLLAIVIGIPLVVGSRVYMETARPDSDLDAVFHLGNIIWSGMVMIIYLFQFLILFYLQRRAENGPVPEKGQSK